MRNCGVHNTAQRISDNLRSVSLPAIAAILFYWIRMRVVQQLTCLTLGRPNGPAYSTDELLNTPLVIVASISLCYRCFLCFCVHFLLVVCVRL